MLSHGVIVENNQKIKEIQQLDFTRLETQLVPEKTVRLRMIGGMDHGKFVDVPEGANFYAHRVALHDGGTHVDRYRTVVLVLSGPSCYYEERALVLSSVSGQEAAKLLLQMFEEGEPMVYPTRAHVRFALI